MIRLRSVHHKLLAIVMVATLAALFVSIGVTIAYDLHAYHQSIRADMETQAELLGHMSSPALAFDDPRLARENLGLLRLRPKMYAGAIYNARGALFASYVVAGRAAAIPQQASEEGFSFAGRRLVLYKRIYDNGELLGTVYLDAEYEMLSRFFDYLVIGVLGAVLAVGTAYLVLRRLSHVITQPLMGVASVAREVVATGDFSRRADRIGKDEIADLAEAFNKMLSEIQSRTSELESSNAEQARAQQEVLRLNAELEQRVHERTMQLELANGELAMAMEEARSANQAKSAFLSSMSHELRTPLNAILGFAQILTSDKLPSTLEQKKEFAGHILKSGRHLLALINEILDLAKIESGTVALSMEPVEMQDILAECRTMMEPLAAQRGIRILFPEHCQTAVQADRTRLKQILLNLLSNAIKYNREGGAVVVDCSEPSSGSLRLSVQDTGMGLKPEQLNMLFQPFNRLGQETGAEEGTGIGLVVTKRLVELMGGSIGVSSSVGVGSMFWIEMKSTTPVAAHLGSEPPPAMPAVHDADSTTVLYVEDNPANLKLVEQIISYRPGLRLLTAPDAQLGLEMARAHEPDIILMDVNLPGMSGLEALRVLRADSRTAHIPVIALTANAMPRDVERGLAAGFFRYLIKPINIDEFTEAINSTMSWLASRKQGKETS
ncbi:ATP-binding protein [Massilia endophytica]|uniref:ATP-binding protein n=1 Tax=Massilia endophytica TaxID=2899220 RepID=UPI001E3652DC|nr:ATP-binding protein [Massilia endophytica]UGQ45790.1 response regulator [Massilia endophytica]